MIPPERRAAAELAKLEAETNEIEARMERALWLADRHEKLFDVRLRKATTEAEAEEIKLAKARRDDALLLTDFRFAHQIDIIGGINRDIVEPLMMKFHQCTVIDPGCDITVVLNSAGGSVMDGLHLSAAVRFARMQGHRVTIIAFGYAASMAGILLQAGDVRVMSAESWLMIHEVAFSAAGKIGEIEDTYRFGERLKQQAADIFIERSGGKLTAEVLRENWTRKDWWLSPAEALELGLIDEVR